LASLAVNDPVVCELAFGLYVRTSADGLTTGTGVAVGTGVGVAVGEGDGAAVAVAVAVAVGDGAAEAIAVGSDDGAAVAVDGIEYSANAYCAPAVNVTWVEPGAIVIVFPEIVTGAAPYVQPLVGVKIAKPIGSVPSDVTLYWKPGLPVSVSVDEAVNVTYKMELCRASVWRAAPLSAT